MLTADEIRKHEYEALEDGSYSKDSVDAYTEELAQQFESLFNENKEIVRRLTIFAKKIEEYKKNESYMTETLLTAQKTAAQTISGAEDVVAKMIEAAKNEGRNIISAAKERSNEIYADRDKILSEAQAQAQELNDKAQAALGEARDAANAEAQSIIDRANEDARLIIEDAKEDIKSTVNEINSGADAVVSEANRKAESTVAEAEKKAEELLAEANARAEETVAEAQRRAREEALSIMQEAAKAKEDAEALKKEAFEIKKEAFEIKKEAMLTNEQSQTEARDFYTKLTSRAKTAAAGVLLKAQADVNRINEELHTYTADINAALASAYHGYLSVKSALERADGQLDGNAEKVPTVEELMEKPVIDVDDAAFVENAQALNEAVLAEDIDAVLRCFGIDAELTADRDFFVNTETEAENVSKAAEEKKTNETFAENFRAVESAAEEKAAPTEAAAPQGWEYESADDFRMDAPVEPKVDGSPVSSAPETADLPVAEEFSFDLTAAEPDYTEETVSDKENNKPDFADEAVAAEKIAEPEETDSKESDVSENAAETPVKLNEEKTENSSAADSSGYVSDAFGMDALFDDDWNEITDDGSADTFDDDVKEYVPPVYEAPADDYENIGEADGSQYFGAYGEEEYSEENEVSEVFDEDFETEPAEERFIMDLDGEDEPQDDFGFDGDFDASDDFGGDSSFDGAADSDGENRGFEIDFSMFEDAAQAGNASEGSSESKPAEGKKKKKKKKR